MSEPIAIIGATGALGFGLTLRWGSAGVPIILGSRDADRAVEAAERARAALPDGRFEGFENAEAATKAEVVVLCVPFRNQSETLTNLKGALREHHLVVDTTVPLAAAVSGRATRTLGVWQGSAAQQAQEMVPDGVRVVSALHTVSASTCGDLGPRSTRTSSSAATTARTRTASSDSSTSSMACAASTRGAWRWHASRSR